MDKMGLAIALFPCCQCFKGENSLETPLARVNQLLVIWWRSGLHKELKGPFHFVTMETDLSRLTNTHFFPVVCLLDAEIVASFFHQILASQLTLLDQTEMQPLFYMPAPI